MAGTMGARIGLRGSDNEIRTIALDAERGHDLVDGKDLDPEPPPARLLDDLR